LALTQEQDQRFADGMRRAQGGDRAAYDALLKEIAVLLRRYFGARAENDEAAEDLVQETLISIHRARHTYMAGRPFAPWMYAIARRRLADHWRSRSRNVVCEQLDETMDWVDRRDLDVRDTDGAVHETLSILPESQRRVVVLLKVDGLSIRETARKLDISEAAVKVTAHRAYVKLRQTMANVNHEHK
jgi:RNA polymerase sigma-70 factor, ECF subfamily